MGRNFKDTSKTIVLLVNNETLLIMSQNYIEKT